MTPLRLPLLLALMSIVALVAMFLLEGFWDGVFFILSLLPMLVGAWCWYRLNPAAREKKS